jgi:hypothetical protein
MYRQCATPYPTDWWDVRTRLFGLTRNEVALVALILFMVVVYGTLDWSWIMGAHRH